MPGALLVRANEAEAELMTGEHDPERAAAALVKAGARMVVITLGADGAILRGEARGATSPGCRRAVRQHDRRRRRADRDAAGRGWPLSGFYPAAVAAALPEAVEAAARACERWGALD